MTPLLRVDDLTKQFGDFKAVNQISFSVKPGEIVGLLGPNGAGKTTTISLLLGLLTPTSGKIRIFDQDLNSHREEILAQVNFSSAYISFPRRLTVRQNLAIFARLYDVQNREQRIDAVIELFKLKDMEHEKYLNLSSGQETRVHLAKAFLNQPRILFLDEPTAALDPDIADVVRKLIRKMQKQNQMTVLLTSHNMSEVEEVCDRVLFINHGQIIAEDSPEALAARISDVKISLMIKDGMKRTLEYCNKRGFLAVKEGRYVNVKVAEADIMYFLSFLSERGIQYQEISIQRPTLEDYFLKQMQENNES